jgi:putative tricarboxylic transport membrane protein
MCSRVVEGGYEMGEKVFAGVCIVFAAVFFGMAMNLTPPRVDTPLNGAFWPGIVLVILFVCSAIEMVRLLRQTKEQREAKAKADERKQALLEEATGEKTVKNLLIFGFVISFIFIIVMDFLSFTVATPIFMAVYMWVTGYRKKLWLVVIPIVSTAVFLLVFTIATYIPLPRGVGIFRDLSTLIY